MRKSRTYNHHTKSLTKTHRKTYFLTAVDATRDNNDYYYYYYNDDYYNYYYNNDYYYYYYNNDYYYYYYNDDYYNYYCFHNNNYNYHNDNGDYSVLLSSRKALVLEDSREPSYQSLSLDLKSLS